MKVHYACQQILRWSYYVQNWSQDWPYYSSWAFPQTFVFGSFYNSSRNMYLCGRKHLYQTWTSDKTNSNENPCPLHGSRTRSYKQAKTGRCPYECDFENFFHIQRYQAMCYIHSMFHSKLFNSLFVCLMFLFFLRILN